MALKLAETEPIEQSLVAQISSPTFAQGGDDTQAIQDLRQLKHAILGHEQQKLVYVELGIVDPLVRLLGKKDGTVSFDVRVEAVAILGSLIHGGTNLVPDAQILRILPILIDALDTSTTSPVLLKASLRTLNGIYDLPSTSTTTKFIECLHTRDFGTFISVLLRDSQTTHQVAVSACALVARSCPVGDSKWPEELVDLGVLAGLTKRLAMVVKRVEKPWTAKRTGLLRIDAPQPTYDRSMLSKSSSMVSLATNQIVENFVSALPDEGPHSVAQAQSTSQISSIFEALAVMLRGDKLRSSEVLFSGWITNLLGDESLKEEPRTQPVWKDSKTLEDSSEKRTNAQRYAFSGQEFPPLSPTNERTSHRRSGSISGPSHSTPAPSLPPISHSHIDHDHDPPLEAQPDHPLQFSGDSNSDPESPMIPWLLSYIRNEKDPNNRLMEINLLTEFVRAGCTSKRRVKTISCLVVPILVRAMDPIDDTAQSMWKACTRSEISSDAYKMRYRAPRILATLITDNLDMQKAARDAEAIKKLAELLKRSFDDEEIMLRELPGNVNIDMSPGFAFEKEKVLDYNLKMREAALKGIAAIALSEDDYRRQVISSGAVDYIRYSLIPEPREADAVPDWILGDLPDFAARADSSKLPSAKKIPATALRGNPEDVLIAATTCVRSLSRSVSILSTDLIDASVCKPLCQLLLFPSVRVKVATTAAICNLAMSFSPMRNTLIDVGIVEIMCKFLKKLDVPDFDEHNEELRLNALWTLKHLVSDVKGQVKKDVLKTIDPKWVIDLIDRNLTEPNPMESYTEDTHMQGEDVYSDPFNVPQPSAIKALESHHIPFSHTVLRRLALKWQPQDSSYAAKKSQLKLQEQALDFIRNLVVQPASSLMIDMLLNSSSNFFAVLTKKLAAKPEPQTIHAVIFILVNIAASTTTHRKKLIEQAALFKELNELFEYPQDQVRSGLTWLAINLTWKDDNGDADDVRERVQRLRDMGFIAGLEWLSEKGKEMEEAGGISITGSMGGDVLAESIVEPPVRISLDVRERCKQALKQISSHS